MIRSTASKVAWVGRTASMVFGLALVMALVVGVASAAFGANGQAWILGKNNAATAITRLAGAEGVNGPMLQLINNNADANDTALDLRVQDGEAPMRVNSTKKVAKLNADRIDDREASSFANGVGGVATNADKLDGSDANQLAPILRAQQDTDVSGSSVTGTTQVNSVSINAPVSGVLIISGIAFVNNQSGASYSYLLNPKVDGSNATPAGWGDYYDASTNGSVGEKGGLSYTVSQPVDAGSHTVTQELGEIGGSAVNFFYNNNELSVQFVPGTQASAGTANAAAKTASGGTSPTGE